MKIHTLCICGQMVEGNSTSKCPCKKKQRRSEADIERNKDLVSSKWRKFRLRIIKRDGAHCQRCLIKYSTITTANMQVHHIKPRIKYPDLTFEETNCVTLCQRCNLDIGIKEQLDFEFEIKQVETPYFL
ncbi:HNH endonuclease signature motif containing protein [Metabacillus dongyingensis]|uniref:HNH endonuclease n=1 Tax=Metabacillus dongyingensis TaxID=2874282 RepID=UPI003B8D0D66